MNGTNADEVVSAYNKLAAANGAAKSKSFYNARGRLRQVTIQEVESIAEESAVRLMSAVRAIHSA